MTPDDLEQLDIMERRFGELTLELRAQARSGAARDATLFVEWMQANYAFHDVIYRAAELPLVERIAKGARRTFIGDRVWQARAELDELYAKNDLQHRAIREAIGARQRWRSPTPRPRARPLIEHAHRGRPRNPRRLRPRARLGRIVLANRLSHSRPVPKERTIHPVAGRVCMRVARKRLHLRSVPACRGCVHAGSHTPLSELHLCPTRADVLESSSPGARSRHRPLPTARTREQGYRVPTSPSP